MYNEEQKILFQFSPELDRAFLQELYGDDLQQAEIVFESSAQQLKTEILLAESRFHDGDIAGLKKVIHKMKPLFGYIGMSETMETFSAFEEVCVHAKEAVETEAGFHNITAVTAQCIQHAESESKRLKQYNTQYL